MRVLSCVAVLLVVLVAVLVQPSSATPYRRNGICACPKIYMPVCGSDDITYANRCLLRCKMDSSYGKPIQLRLAREGECERKAVIEMAEEHLD
uniref:Kazal-like domain-containing protein n=1 Tax=Anopheles epiroticus TaxID=199890 RepID=A0A182P945_9DIPT